MLPESDTWGTKHVREALADLEFPMDKAKLVARAGNWRIPLTGAAYVPLAQMLANVPDRSYRNADEVARAIEKA